MKFRNAVNVLKKVKCIFLRKYWLLNQRLCQSCSIMAEYELFKLILPCFSDFLCNMDDLLVQTSNQRPSNIIGIRRLKQWSILTVKLKFKIAETLDNIYLRWETLYQDGNKKIEKHIVAKSHESHKVQSGPVTGLLHSVEQHDVPVFLCEYLAHVYTFRRQDCTQNIC